MSDPASAAMDEARNRLRGWKKLVKPPRWVRRPALWVVLAAGCGVLGWEVLVAVRLLLGGGA